MTEFSDSTLTFLGIFFLGLGLNLTPCVYPMVSVTVSLFRTPQQSTRFHSFLRALVYVLGMSVIYSTLGVITAFTGGLFGAALQSRWVLLGIGCLMFGMAGSLFGFYVIQAPQWMMKLASRRSTDLIGIFLSGLFVGVFAAPCIGPLIIALIAFVAQKGDPFFAFRVFFTLSLGLGLPYIVLGTFAGLLQKLPKSGMWLVWIDRLFGTVLLAVGAFYLILAFDTRLLPWLFPAAFILGGLYLGFVETSKNYSSRFKIFKRIAGTLAIAAGIFILAAAPKQKVIWEMFTPPQWEETLKRGKPVVVDFYADWCIPCHELDQFTYTNREVIEKLEGFSRVKVDLTDPEGDAIDALIDRYEIVGVPTVLFLDAEGNEIEESRITGFVPAEDFLQILDEKVLKR